MRFILLVILLYGMCFKSTTADSVVFDDCGSLYYLDEVLIDGCSSLPCIFNQGSSYNITFKLYAEFDSIDFSQNAVFIHSGIKYSLGVDPQSLCGKKLSCPLSTGDDASFTSLVNINDTLPMTWMSGELSWTTVNESSEEVVCMRTQAVIRRE